MEPEEFCSALKNSMPDPLSVDRSGLSNSHKNRLFSSYMCIPRNKDVIISTGINFVDKIYSKFDLSNIEIGMIRLTNLPKKSKYGWILGNVEADYIEIINATGEVVVKDINDIDNILWKCSKNPQRFFQALVLCSEYLTNIVFPLKKSECPKGLSIEDCINVAGGADYEGFYRMILLE